MDDVGFSLPGEEATPILWSSIRCIRAYKKDLITTDEVFLSFENDGIPEYVEMSEEDPGFEEFRLFLETRFEFPALWWEAVLQPPFVRNGMVLYIRAQQVAPGDAPEAARP